VKGPGWLSFIHLKFLFQARLQRGNVHLKQAQLNEAKADYEKVVRVCQWFLEHHLSSIAHTHTHTHTNTTNTHNVTYNNDFKPVVCELASSLLPVYRICVPVVLKFRAV
jgi:hypothetical protein